MPEKNILIADDDQGILDILKEMIQREGYRVFLASNGKEAVEAIKINPIDLAILDIKMPVMDGIEALKGIKKIDQGIEVLIMTGYADLETLKQAVSDYGAFDYILKPFKRADILNGIQNALLKQDFASQKKPREKELEERILQLEKEFLERTHQLRESQIKYKDIVENSNDAIVVVQDGKLKFANTKTIELTGYPREELKDMSFLEMVHPEDRDMVEEIYKREDFPGIFSFRALRKSGESLWVEINTVRTTWEKRQATLNVIRDISERKQAEERLRSLTSVVEQSTDSIISTDTQFRITYMNPAAEKLYGCSFDEARGETPGIFNAEPNSDEIQQAIYETASAGKTYTDEWLNKRKDGSTFYCQFKISPLFDESDNIIGYMGSQSDITERKQAEEALRESEEKYSSVVENSMDGIILLQKGIIKFLNQAIVELSGYNLEELIDREFQSLISPEYRKLVMDRYEDRLAGKEVPSMYEMEIIRKDGISVQIEISNTIITYKGEKSTLSFIRNITERKQAEEKEKEHHKNIQLLSNTAMRFVEFPADKNIYNFIGEQLRELIGKDSYIVISTIDEEKSILTTRTVLGLGKLSDKVAGLLGKHPVGMTLNAKDENLSDLSDGKLHLNEEGLYAIFLKTVPKAVCNSIEKLLNIKKTYGIGFTKENELFGTVVIILKENAGELKNKQIIEAFIKQASIAVQKMQAEETLRQSEKNYRDLFNNATDAIYIQDKEGRFLDVNQGAVEMYGYPKGFFIGKTPEFLSAPGKNDMKKIIGFVEDAFNGKPRQYDFWGIRKNGEVFPKIVRSQQGVYMGKEVVVTFALDITERKQAEEAVRESEAQKMAILDGSIDRIRLVDKDMKIIWANKTTARELNIAPGDLIGQFCYKAFVGRDRPCDKCPTKKTIKTGKIEHAILKQPFSKGIEGESYWDGYVVPIKNESGDIVNLIQITRDITERKRAEEQFRRSNEEVLKEHNQRKMLSKRLIDLLEKDRRQIAMELHDHIGQTLTSIKMNLEMIHGKLKPGHTELGAQMTAAQEKTIQAIKDVKNVSYGLRPAMIDALGVVSSLRELFYETQQQTNMEIHFFSRGIPKRFEEEKELAIYRISQEALVNIVRHARAKNIFVNLVKKDENLSLSVEDDGIGFDQAKVMKTSKRKGPLGLLIMRERAIQFDGEFTIESQPGKGTHLLVEIPL